MVTFQEIAGSNNNVIRLYIDGALVDEDTSFGASVESRRFYVGSHSDADGANPVSFWDGKMGIVRLYERALSPDEVFENYNATRSMYD